MIDIGDGDACVFKMESHNHPSFIEPYQGAATGVGGILRDVFTMGARPVACLNLLRFGAPDHPEDPASGRRRRRGDRRLRQFVRRADRRRLGRLPSSAMTATSSSMRWRSASPARTRSSTPRRPASAIRSSISARRPGATASTARRMASAAFEADAEEKRPTVQVGDPFAEKLLLEACLELMASGAVIAIQDMGAAGLTSSAAEMGAKGDLGIELDLDHVPCRETGMTRLRDDALGEPGAHAHGAASPRKSPRPRPSSANGGSISRSSARRPTRAGSSSSAAARSRPTCRSRSLATKRRSTTGRGPETPRAPALDAASIMRRRCRRDAALLKLLASPDLCSKRWVYEQYDTLILGNTVAGARAATPRWCGSATGPRAWR